MDTKLNNSTDSTKLVDIMDQIDKESLKKILSNMNTEDLVKQLDGIEENKVNTIIGMLSTEKLYDIIKLSNAN